MSAHARALDCGVPRAHCAELAGRLTEWAGETARAREVYELALEQYRGLENARGVQRIEKTLEQL
jgi:hypothetical protein